MKIFTMLKYLMLVLTLGLLAACSGGGANTTSTSASASKVSLQLDFVKANVSKASVTDIHSLVLQVIPANSSSNTPAPIDLTPYMTGSSKQPVTIPNLTDNETYLFRVVASNNSGTIIYTGQSTALLLPGSNAVNLTCYEMNGFDAVAGSYFGSSSFDPSSVDTFNINASGIGSRTSSSSWSMHLYLSATATSGVYAVNFFNRNTNGIIEDIGSGTLNAATGSASGTGIEPSTGTSMTWTITKGSPTPVPPQPQPTVGTPFLLASGYKSFVLDTGTANTVYHLNNNATGVPYALVNTGTPQALTANTASDRAPLGLARGTNGYLIAWTEANAGTYYIMGRLLGPSGAPTGSPFIIDSSTQSQEGAVHIAFDGTNYLVVWPQLATMSTTNIVGRYVNSTGTVVNSVTIAAGIGINASDVGIIFAAGQYFVAYSDGVAPSFNYYLRSVSTGGTVSTATQINTTTSQNDNPTGLAYDGTNLLITMHIFTIDDTIGHLYGRRFSTARVAIGGEFPIATGTTRKFGGWPTFDGTNFLIAYTDFGATSATVYGQRISTAGALVGSPFTIANNAAFGVCSYASASSRYQCLYHTYATYVQSVQSMFANINNLYGVTVQPGTATTGGLTLGW